MFFLVLKRILLGLITLFIVSLITFSGVEVLPGDACTTYLEREAYGAALEACYERLGLKAIPMRADTGPIGGDYSHEFLVLAETGESNVFYDRTVAELSLNTEDINYEDSESIQGIVNQFTKYLR